MLRVLLLLFLLLAPLSVSAQEKPYRLNPGDILQISVWKEENLQREVVVLPDGTISFPLAGHLKATGKSPQEIEKILADRMRKYIPDLVITVSVKSVTGYKVYVIGQVKLPGEFPASGFMDVMQALSRAGGLTPFASEKNIKVLRRRGGKQQAMPFNYGEVKRGENLKQNIVLQSGDVVVVPN